MTDTLNKLLLASLRAVSNPITLDAGYPAAACFKNMNLVEIPEVMDRRGFKVGAALMRRWFTSPAFTMPTAWKDNRKNNIDQNTIPNQYIDESIVKMQWALNYSRTQTAYNELRQAVLGHLSPASLHASQDELFTKLRRSGHFKDTPTQFGVGTVRMVHESGHVNSRAVSANFQQKLTEPIDDLYVSLGAFTLHIAASGKVVPVAKRVPTGPTHDVIIDKFGVYIRDIYDFNSDQPLGLWDRNGPTSMPRNGLIHVENASFRKWRARFSRGGDFIIFSDIQWFGLPRPQVWQFTMPKAQT